MKITLSVAKIKVATLKSGIADYVFILCHVLQYSFEYTVEAN